MSNSEFLELASTLKTFEINMDIEPFQLPESESSLLSDFDRKLLSFENDTLSFENDKINIEAVKEQPDTDKVVNSKVSESTKTKRKNKSKEKILIIGDEDRRKIYEWLDHIFKTSISKHVRAMCSLAEEQVTKGSITYSQLYKSLEDIKDAYNHETKR